MKGTLSIIKRGQLSSSSNERGEGGAGAVVLAVYLASSILGVKNESKMSFSSRRINIVRAPRKF
jgi:hypothetical protein